MLTFSCDPGYSLHGSTTSQCVSGEWIPSPETVMCVAGIMKTIMALYFRSNFSSWLFSEQYWT